MINTRPSRFPRDRSPSLGAKAGARHYRRFDFDAVKHRSGCLGLLPARNAVPGFPEKHPDIDGPKWQPAVARRAAAARTRHGAKGVRCRVFARGPGVCTPRLSDGSLVSDFRHGIS